MMQERALNFIICIYLCPVSREYGSRTIIEIRSHIEYLMPSGNIIVLVLHLKLTNYLISLTGFNTISYDLLIIRKWLTICNPGM